MTAFRIFSVRSYLLSDRLKNKLFLIPLVLFFVSLMFYSYNIEGQPWHGDEIFWNAGGGVFFKLLQNNDLLNPCWNGLGECNLLYEFGWAWPSHASHIAHIFTGFSQYLSGQSDKDYLTWSSWHHDFWEVENTPTPKEFAAGRLFAVIFGSLTIVTVYFIGNLLFNKFVATTFSLLLLFHPLWFYNSRVAMTEVYVGFFLILSIFLIFYYIKSNNKLKYLILSGFLFGVAFNAKYSSLPLLLLPLSLIWTRGIFVENLKINRRIFFKLIYLSTIFLGVFIVGVFITNPYFYPNPVTQLPDLLLGSQEEFREILIPTLENDNIFRMLAAFHSSIIPYSVNYYDFNSYDDGQLHLSWELPYTYSTIPISFFFFIGMGFLVIKIITKKLQLSEFIILLWFLITFVEIFLTVRVFWAERFFVPLIFPIVLISAYGIWQFFKYISNSRARSFFYGFIISCSAASTLVFYDFFYNSPGKYSSRLIEGTVQSIVTRTDTFLLMLSFLIVSLCILYFFILRTKIHTKKKRILVMILISTVSLTLLLPDANEDIIAESTFEKTVNIKKEMIFSTIADVSNYPKIFPGKVQSVTIINQTDNIIYSRDMFEQGGIKTEFVLKHTIFPYDSQKIEIVKGDAEGTVIDIIFQENNNSTKIIVNTEVHLKGILKPFGAALQLSHEVMEKTTNKILNQFENYAKSNST